MMSARKTAVVVGILFITQMITAMIGSSQIQAFVDGGSRAAVPVAGVLWMLASAVAVVAIGFLMYGVLKPFNPRLARWYPIMRLTEFAVSTAAGIYLLMTLQVLPNHMLWVYVPTAIGGVIFTYLLTTTRLVPRWIALLGLAGYICLGLGVPLDLLGLVDMNNGLGMILLAPGGLFEVILLPIYLMSKGFRSAQPAKA